MCGRFVQSASAQALAELFDRLGLDAAPDEGSSAPRYNLAPTQPALALCGPGKHAAGKAAFTSLTFGLQRGETGQVINARSETLPERPMFRGLLGTGRCLVIASGFYEWRAAADGGKTPYFFAREDGAPFGFAALHGRRAAGPPHRTCAAGGFVIVTTAANDVVAPLHHRMPVMLDADEARAWLDAELEVPAALELLRPYAGPMRAHAVGRAVNNPRHDAPDCIMPA